MDIPEIRVKVLEAEVKEFKKYLGSLSPEDLQKPSACVDWTVADVVGHLAGWDFAARVNRGLQGDFSPEEGASAVADHDEDQFAQNIFRRARTTREQHGEQLIDVLKQRLADSLEVLNSVSGAQWDTLCYHPPGPEPVRTLLDMRISELTMHAWDIRSVRDAEYHLSGDSVRVLIDTVNRAARRAFRPDPSLEKPIRHRFTLTGPVNTAWDIVVMEAGAQVEPAGTPTPDVIFRCNGETYVMVMYGRLKLDAAIAEGSLTSEGNQELALRFGQRFVGG